MTHSGRGWRGKQARDARRVRDIKTVEAPCPVCGKRQYTSKKAARQAARKLFPGEARIRGMKAYPACMAGFFHIGHPRLKRWVAQQQEGSTA